MGTLHEHLCIIIIIIVVSSSMALRSNADLLQITSVFYLSFNFVILHLLVSVHNSTICFLVVLLVDFPQDYF
jgi:hypothetical protein